MEFDPDTLQITLDVNQSLQVDALYEITVILTDRSEFNPDNTNEYNSYTMIIDVTPNLEPYFETWEGIIHLKEDSGKQSYLLPEIQDPEGYEVQIDFGFGNTAPFTVWDQSTNQLIFYLNDESAVVGEYMIAVSLKD